MSIAQNMPKHENTQTETQRTREQELKDAVDRVQRHYGKDISAFFRDAHREAQQLEKRAR